MPRTALLLVGVLALAGCAPTPIDTDDGVVRVVASTNVYGSIAEAIGGDRIEVTSIVSDPAQDPHSVDGGVRVQLALAKADVIIENGGGYDDWMETLLGGVDNAGAAHLNVTDLSGYDTSGDFNEHLWYDFVAVETLVQPLVDALSDVDPEGASLFEANAADFTDGLARLRDREAAIAEVANGAGVAITEPVPLALLTASGFENRTPPEFSEAIEEGDDVPPTVLRDTLALLTNHQVAMLVYNEQTTSAETEQVLRAAEDNDVPVVPVTETLPPTLDYLGWMNANLDAIGAAL